jgi:cell division protein FtsB
MVLRHTNRRQRRSRGVLLVLLSSLSISAYFVHHTINGKHGIEARARLIDRSRQLEQEIAGLDTVRARLQRDVTLLRAEPPHPDVVEEVAGGVLGMAKPQDLIIPLPRPEAAPRSANLR